jgi:cytoskeleton protein RodZ
MKAERFNGDVLRERREAMGLTLQETYHKVRVPQQYIELLEASNVRQLPPACYTTGFLRTYARFLGLDPEPLVSAYRESVEPGHRAFLQRTGELCEFTSTRRFSNLLAWAAVCGVIALCWFAYMTLVQPQDTIEAAPNEIVAPAPPPSFFDE